MGLQTHISHRLLGPPTHAHKYIHTKSQMTPLPLTGAADIAFPAGQKAFSTSLYCP